ncbi:Hypothetical protein MCYN_0547 [Mycoplasmopsis cynos C142]|uniref:Uncharacterized protein n=1 Tax=Mycoplasmopsis cynos (strain C142) TaxID=1246955 RepID=L0RUU2_MYCC1|nr:Hypothetical protein MCYN_0547 [Mycoplasmopsis cynos C142]
MEQYSRGWRGGPAKTVGEATPAEVQILSVPPFFIFYYFEIFLFSK